MNRSSHESSRSAASNKASTSREASSNRGSSNEGSPNDGPSTGNGSARKGIQVPGKRRSPRRHEPDALSGNFILMPSLLDHLSPDLTLPEQYFASQLNDDAMGPERALMYAVLKDGIRCFYKHAGASQLRYRRMSDEAETWIAEDCWEYPFSFRTVCDMLNIDGVALREQLMKWKRAEFDRRNTTGDTHSLQVGRSPFPATPLGNMEGALKVPATDAEPAEMPASVELDDDEGLGVELESLEDIDES